MQSKRVVDFYLEELHLLGAELSLDRARVSISAQLQELVGRSPDASPRRAAEPYRRAVVGIYARLVATARGIRPGGPAAPRGDAGATLCGRRRAARRSRRALSLAVRQRLGADRARPAARLRRAVEVFGFHLASSICGRTRDVHERTLAELLETGAGADYAADAGAGAHRAAAGGARDGAAADLAVRDLFGRRRRASSTILRTAADAHRRYGRTPSPTTSSPRPRRVSDILEVALLLKEVGLLRPREGTARRQHRAAVRDHRRSAQLRRRSWTRCSPSRPTRGCCEAAAACRRSCSAIPTATRTAAS